MLLFGVAICFVTFCFVFSLFLSFFHAHGVTWQIVESQQGEKLLLILSWQRKRTFVFLAPVYNYYNNSAPTLAPQTFMMDCEDLMLREKSSTCQPATSYRMLIHIHLIYMIGCMRKRTRFLLLYMAVISTACRAVTFSFCTEKPYRDDDGNSGFAKWNDTPAQA